MLEIVLLLKFWDLSLFSLIVNPRLRQARNILTNLSPNSTRTWPDSKTPARLTTLMHRTYKTHGSNGLSCSGMEVEKCLVVYVTIGSTGQMFLVPHNPDNLKKTIG